MPHLRLLFLLCEGFFFSFPFSFFPFFIFIFFLVTIIIRGVKVIIIISCVFRCGVVAPDPFAFVLDFPSCVFNVRYTSSILL
ncbi:hypothetical protein BO78DRAFT_203331 [Aspergillus sclerotiicarbonarius CBS 121057]|uniref:Uncharacterized protein n=1 Tax=Aspergillus sclerotiicarbonarius (strain CBS 121057 / IBT 28362) TaxID=1448318 RepID=A0A319ERW1_ASPSB|nr:hypothetical protein BO78DRAFT_203331 [Aspergillus sclerotiicarbonarius CBS 121057]